VASGYPTGAAELSAPLVGIDLVEPQELAERLKQTPELREELFLPGEVAYANSQYRPVLHLAARFAAKEAVVKALGLYGWDPLEIEVTGGGEDVGLRLHGDARDRADDLGVLVSISMTHVNSLTAAVALARPT
jgi:holo-[acyl-carrier protein] synthase